MDRQAYSKTREVIVAKAIESVVSELRMVDVADYVAYIKLERFANISDLVASAAELYFMPGTLRLGPPRQTAEAPHWGLTPLEDQQC